MFPLLESKYTLATKKELKPFLPFAHKLAALDFIVSLNSDVFMSNAAGNFPNVLVQISSLITLNLNIVDGFWQPCWVHQGQLWDHHQTLENLNSGNPSSAMLLDSGS